MVQYVELTRLYAHPGNPRLSAREDVIEQIAAQLNGRFDEAHALLVRPNGAGYEIISGHHRKAAAERAGIKQVPVWVREMSDEDAYMALALCNAQGELHPLEVGLHALKSGLSVREYGARSGQSKSQVDRFRSAAEVACPHLGTPDLADRWRHLAEIHAAPAWLWSALVEAMLPNKDDPKGWTVEATQKQVGRFTKLPAPPQWVDATEFAKLLLESKAKASDIGRFEKIAAECEETLRRAGDDADRLVAQLWRTIKQRRPKLISELEAICVAIESEQRELVHVRRQGDLLRVKREDEITARIARLRRNVSLKEWNDELQPDERAALLNLTADDVDPGSFNPQENEDIGWAMSSWNPVTGCLHDCPYCYARDISGQERMSAVYPHGFEPVLRPAMLLAPRHAKPPKEAATDARYKNVFTCSMADLFGRWVPDEWIKAVLNEIRNAPEWNFLCLTKFPKRMAEFDIPPNTWMGTTVDLQARVPAAEAAFAKVNAAVKWLSVEPMLEPLTFKHLELFDWIVVGGASAQSGTPAWHPPSQWVFDLKAQARAAGLAWYEKTNLWGHRIKDKTGEITKMGTPRTTELPLGLPVIGDSHELPEIFRYLGRATTANQKIEEDTKDLLIAADQVRYNRRRR